MGLGIHGEPGAYKRSMAPAKQMVTEVCGYYICSHPAETSIHSLLTSEYLLLVDIQAQHMYV